MSILFPGSSIERGEWLLSASTFSIDTVNPIESGNGCLVNFFGQLVEIDIEYANLSPVGVSENPGSPGNVAGENELTAFQKALTVIKTHQKGGNTFKNIISPTFTPGAIRTITRETGNYQEYAGQTPSELTFSVRGIDTQVAAWSRTFLTAIRPMSMGVYLKNDLGDLMGLMVKTIATESLIPSPATKYAFLPIPILGLRRASTGLGGYEEPDLTHLSILFPPNWDSPYAYGSTLDTMSASLKTIKNRLGRIVSSAVRIIPNYLIEALSEI